MPVQQLLREIRELGYQGSSNLLVRYINQGRLEGDRPHLSPRQAARILLTRPDGLTASQQETLAGFEAACTEMTALAGLVRSFAALLAPDLGNDAKLRQWIDAKLRQWITDARAADLPHVHSFARGLDLDIQAATAGLTLPHHNGRTEGVNTKTKMIKRQMYGRACFTLLRHRILLGLRYAPLPPKVRQSRLLDRPDVAATRNGAGVAGPLFAGRRRRRAALLRCDGHGEEMAFPVVSQKLPDQALPCPGGRSRRRGRNGRLVGSTAGRTGCPR